MQALELFKHIQDEREIIILDVREYDEIEICKLENSIHIPLNLVPEKLDSIPKEREIVVLCHHGIRSAMVANFLNDKGYLRVHNLEGGIHAWATEIDGQMKKY